MNMAPSQPRASNCQTTPACGTIIYMIKHNQDGAVNALLLPLILATVFLLGALAFGVWAYGERQNYKNNTDAIVAQAVVVGKKAEAVSKDKQYAELAKSPLKTYNGPEQYGSVVVMYPKTWSGYIDGSDQSDAGLNAYFHPDVVPAVGDENNAFALRVQVLNQAYSETLSSFDQQEGLAATPYALPKVPKTVGVKLTGQISDQKQGTVVLLPLRDKTLQISTESKNYQPDFETYILPNFSFSP